MSDTKDPKKVAAGKARAASLAPSRRREIGMRAAVARWGIKATHTGNFREEFGIDVDCYVLDDAHKTAVISQSGMARVLGLSPRGNAFPRFLASKGMSETVGAELSEKVGKPIKFQWGSGGAGQPPASINGYDVSVLIEVCQAIAEANSKKRLARNQQQVAIQASIVMAASARSGIKQLVYALAGYNPTIAEVIESFKLYVQEEARKYEPEFPNELYMHWHRLYEIPVPERGKPWHFKFLTVRHIYYPLAKSRGKIYELLKILKASHGDRRKKMFQFLNDIGAKALRMHLGRVLEMAEDSKTRAEYENRITARFGGQLELELLAPSDPIALPPPS